MQKIKTADLFKAARLVQKSNMKEELKPIIKIAASESVDVADLGIEGMLTIIETLSQKNMEDAIYDLLSGPFEMTPEDVGNMELEELAEKLEVLAKENNLKGFFTHLSSLITSK